MQVTKNYAPTPWSNDGSTLSDKYGNDLFVAEDGEDIATLALFDAAPDLVEALIDQAKETEAEYLVRVNRSFNVPPPSETSYQRFFTTSAREALTKAGVITE